MRRDLTLQVGLEPTTNRLTVDRSTTELLKPLLTYILYFGYEVRTANSSFARVTEKPLGKLLLYAALSGPLQKNLYLFCT